MIGVEIDLSLKFTRMEINRIKRNKEDIAYG